MAQTEDKESLLPTVEPSPPDSAVAQASSSSVSASSAKKGGLHPLFYIA